MKNSRTYKYKTEAGFHKAMSIFGDRVLYWYGTDHHWILEVLK